MKYLHGILMVTLGGLVWISGLIDLRAETGDLGQDPLFQSETKPKAQPAKLRTDGSKSNSDRLVNEAFALDKKKSYADIITLLKPHVGSLSRRGLLLLAKAYGESRDSMNEISTLELCLAKNPQDYYVQTLLGEAYAKTKRSEQAIGAFQEAIQTNKKFERAYEGLLSELAKKGENYEARTLITDMIKVFGKKPRYLSLHCRLFSSDGFLEKAIEVCDEAMKADPKNPANFHYLGASLKDQEETERAIQILSTGAKKFPNDENIHVSLASLQNDKKNFPEAYANYKIASQTNAKSIDALIGLANAAYELQKYDESLQSFLKACRIDRKITKDFRIVTGKLRSSGKSSWAAKFEDGLSKCM